MTSKTVPRLAALALAATAVFSSGCATKKYVRAEVGTTETRLTERDNALQSQIESNQTDIREQGERIDQVSATAREAIERALEAGKLAEGQLLYETVLTDDRVRFGFDLADISPEAKSALDEFARRAVSENADIYIEIQGHTDSVGSDEYNTELGEKRAEAVRRYLSREHKLPLHRMSVISYGEAAPIADNGSREGRAQNRRVSLVVLK